MADNRGGDLEQYRTVVTLRDGSALLLRPIRPEDEDRLLALFYRFSSHTVYLRFHHVLTHMSREEVAHFCAVDYDNSMALVGTVGEGNEEEIIAVGRYARLPRGDAAEVAFVVEDARQGKGIGTHLLEQLAEIARKKGIGFFEAEILAGNQEMVKVLTDSGFRLDKKLEQGIYRMVLDLTPIPSTEVQAAERERVATIASLRAFLRPRSIAVVGASTRRGSVGNSLFHNILRGEFNGVVYPVNPGAEVVASVKAYPSVLEIPGTVDLAVVAVPAGKVQEVVAQCGRKGVRGVVVISAGFGETGSDGAERQERLLHTARSHGMRLVGPNCMGIINTDPTVRMNATFTRVSPRTGNIAFGAQSGALGLAVLEYADALDIGVSTFVSLGNRADVSNNDLLQYWAEDPATEVILLYVESFGNPRKFARIARNAALTKPIVVVKGGRTPAGSRAAASHTGALATSEVAYDALFAQTGLIRVDTLEEFLDTATLLSHQPVPQGRSVAIVTNGGGLGILTADACAAHGLELPSLSDATIAGMGDSLTPRASLGNPIDMTAEATAADYARMLRILAQDDAIDITIAIFIPPMPGMSEDVAGAIRDTAPEFRRRGKVLVASFVGQRGGSAGSSAIEEARVPRFSFPEAAAAALARAYQYGEWTRKPKGVVPALSDVNKERAEEIVKSTLERNSERPLWLDAASVNELLACYGIRTAPMVSATSAEEAARAAAEVGFPVAVKLLSSTITHKTDVGGVVLGLHSTKEVEEAFRHIRERLANAGREAEMDGVIVQRMIPEGVEAIVGVTQDPSFGPLVMFGMGGIYSELLKDVTFRIHPLTDIDASEMVRSVKAYRLLEGWRGSMPADTAAVEELLLSISAMVEDLPQIHELDLNPVKVLEGRNGYVVIDARVMLAGAPGT